MTEESEYKILRYLNDRNEEYNVQDNQLRGLLHTIPNDKYDKLIGSLLERKYIDHKTQNERGWTITTDGQKELNYLQTTINNKTSENLITSTKFNMFATLFLAISAVVISLFQFGQQTRQTDIMERQLKSDSITNNKYQIVHDTIYIRDTTTIKK